MKKLNVFRIACLLTILFVSCEKEPFIESEEQVTAEQVIDQLKKRNNEEPGENSKKAFIFIEDLSIVNGTWDVKGIKEKSARKFTPENEIDSNRLFSSANLSNASLIKIEGSSISLLDANGDVLNALPISNYTVGSFTIAGLFDVVLGSETSRISVTSNNGDLRLGQFFNGESIEYRLKRTK